MGWPDVLAASRLGFTNRRWLIGDKKRSEKMKVLMVLVVALAATVSGCASIAPDFSQSTAAPTVPEVGATCDFQSSERPKRAIMPGWGIPEEEEDWGICGRIQNGLSP